MSQFLELSDDVYASLREAAEQNGTTPEGWIAAQLPRTREKIDNGAKTLYDVLKDRIGGFRSETSETLSEDCGGKFTDYLEQKRREGRL